MVSCSFLLMPKDCNPEAPNHVNHGASGSVQETHARVMKSAIQKLEASFNQGTCASLSFKGAGACAPFMVLELQAGSPNATRQYSKFWCLDLLANLACLGSGGFRYWMLGSNGFADEGLMIGDRNCSFHISRFETERHRAHLQKSTPADLFSHRMLSNMSLQDTEYGTDTKHSALGIP